MNAIQWTDYSSFKTGEKLVADYYAAVHECQQQAIRSILGDTKVNHALDIACGYGDSSLVVSQWADKVTGVDSSDHLIDLAIQKHGDNPAFDFVCSSFQDFESKSPAQFLNATWFLNHLHSEHDLAAAAAKICKLVEPGGAVCFVVPGDAFTGDRHQAMAFELGWQQAWYEFQPTHTRGVFRYGPGDEWIETTIWQPITIMRMFSRCMDLSCWDVKSTLVRNDLLPEMICEPPFEVLVGRTST